MPSIANVSKPAYIDIAGAAEHFHVSIWTIRRWIKREVLPAVILPGGLIRIPVAALDDLAMPVEVATP